MLRFLAGRLLQSMLILLGVTIITFALSFLIPADPVRMIAGRSASPEAVESIRHQLGLDQPIPVQYARYLGNLIQGDLGRSYVQKAEVTELIASRLPATLELMVAAIFFELLLGLPAGIYSATRRNQTSDKVVMVLSFIGVSAPQFVVGLLLLYVFAHKLNLFPLGGYGTFAHVVLPALTLGITIAGWYSRMGRSSMVDVLRQDYIRTARAKGLSEWCVVLVHGLRNAILPYLDKIVFEVGQEPQVALLRLKRGEVDVLGDPIPSANFLTEKNDPANANLIVKGDLLHTGYITMNVTEAPFDNKLVRQAVNMSISKERIVRIINGRGSIANQPLPPAMPGYDPNYVGYAFDPGKARDMLAEAGYPDGFATELFVMNTDPNPRIAQSVQQDLAAIGIKAEIKSLAQSTVIAAGGAGTAPMLWSGGMAWIADYPDPSNFYGPILGCGGAAPGGWNWAKYCNEEIDALAAKADSMASPDQAAERIDLWRQIFLKIMDDAPWVPVFNEVRFAMHSARIGGKDVYFADPIHIPVNYESVFANDVE